MNILVRKVTEETLQEGRLALFELEKQLKLRSKPKELLENSSSKVVEKSQGNILQEVKSFENPLSPVTNTTTVIHASVISNNHTQNGKQQNAMSNRKMMDQIPRGARLTQRLESLGLTVEELDDRGLIEGGAGSLPGSQYSSVRSRSRRSLELQSRSHRLQERGKEALSKVRNGLCHALKVLSRRGVDFERYCRRFCNQTASSQRSSSRLSSNVKYAPMTKKQFFMMLKSIGLPLSARELHDITQYYALPQLPTSSSGSAGDGPESTSSANTAIFMYDISPTETDARSRSSDRATSDYADYMGLLRDARILPGIPRGRRGSLPEEDEEDELGIDIDQDIDGDLGNDDDIQSYTQVLSNLKSMLLESTKKLGKHQDDVYRMFARWDTQGTGSVTATQFLRVLARLHVELSDQDQDFLVELLDTNAMGRIEFENLLNFCFATGTNGNYEPQDYVLSSPVSTAKHISRAPSGGTGEDHTETVSAVSIGTKETNAHFFPAGGDVDKKARAKDLQRPHTASSTLSRPYAEQTNYIERSTYNISNSNGPCAQLQTHSLVLPPQSLTEFDSSIPPVQTNYRRMNSDGLSSWTNGKDKSDGHTNGVAAGAGNIKILQRPQTASGRVSSSNTSSNNNRPSEEGPKESRKHSTAPYSHLDSIYDDMEVYDDVLFDENIALQSSEPKSDLPSQGLERNISSREHATHPNQEPLNDLIYESSENEEIVVTGAVLESDRIADIARIPPSRDSWNSGLNGPAAGLAMVGGSFNNFMVERSDFRKGLDYGSEVDWKGLHLSGYHNPPGQHQQSSDMATATVGFADRESDPLEDDPIVQEDEPIEHLVLLANQILSTLRDIVMTRYRRGKGLPEIYQQFDRNNKKYFDANDFVQATADLRLETSTRVAAIAVNIIGMTLF